MEKSSIVSPIKMLNDYLTKNNIRDFKKANAKYLSINKDLVHFQIELNPNDKYGTLKMTSSHRSVVLRVIVIPNTGICTATPIQIGDGLRKVVLNDFALLSYKDFSLDVT